MRNFFVFIMMFLLAITALPQEKNIKIHKKKPPLALNYHKANDVVIYKATLTFGERTGDFYVVNFYRNEDNTLRQFQCFYGSYNKFNKALYNWENDSTVSIRLLNSKNKKQEALKVFGKGGTTRIITQ